MKNIEISTRIMDAFHNHLLGIGYRHIEPRKYRRKKGVLQFKEDGAMNHAMSREFSHFLDLWLEQDKIFIEKLS